MSTFEELKQEILNKGGTDFQANEFLKTIEPERINSSEGFINSKIEEIKAIVEPNNVEEENIVDDIETTPTVKKTRKKLTVKEKREKYLSEIAKHKEIIDELELKLKTLEDQELIKQIKKLSVEEKQDLLDKLI